jgi:hypothetical protein
MAVIHPPLPVKLFIGVLTSIPEIIPKAERMLEPLFGRIDSRSESFLFDSTHYYDGAMGTPIYRCFLAFSDLIEPSAIAEAKAKTNTIEMDIACEYRSPQRPINLDPGYMEQSKIVLASTKNFYHRILVSGGIYAEVTLHFEGGKWHSFPWTFPDFKAGRYYPFFTSLRELYRSQLSGLGFSIRQRGRQPG